jgi:subtilisin family serine protease
VASVILGFRYLWAEPALPEFFNGVAPKATIIPINVFNNRDFHWGSVIAHAIVYVTELKTSGALGNAPLVINLSNGGPEVDLLELAAIDYAIAHGIVVVACAGNEAEAGMRFPGRYAPVISAAATAWVGTFQPKGSNLIDWIQNDIPEADATEHLIATFSAWELPGQDLDVAAPGAAVPVPGAHAANGQIDYDFVAGTSFASPHVAGIAALMLQKNPSLTASQIESILENTAMAIPSSCRDVLIPAVGPGNPPSWSDLSNVALLDVNICWEANVTGAGLVQADAALAATPLP